MEQQHPHAKWYLYPGKVEEEMEEEGEEEEKEVGLQIRVSKQIKNFSYEVGEESDSSISRSSRVIVEEFVENPVRIQYVKDGVVSATIEEVKDEPIPELELEGEKEAETIEVLTKEVNINESAIEKAEAVFDGGEEEGEEDNATNDFNSTVHVENEEGFESIQTHCERETNVVEKCVSEALLREALGILEEISDAPKVKSSQILTQHKEISGVENLRDSKLPSFTELHEDGSKQLNSTIGIREDVDIDVIEEVFPDETEEFDVERVLEEQNTHDLFCPNCHSCITRRVILRRKKRKIRNLRYRANYKAGVSNLNAAPAVEAPSQSLQAITAITATTTDAPAAPPADSNDNRDAEVFRCPSCFSFLIPIGNGLFKIFGGKYGAQNVSDQPEIPAAEGPLISFFPNKKKKETDQDNAPATQQSPAETNQGDESKGVNENQPAQNDSTLPIETSALPEDSIPSVGLVNDPKLPNDAKLADKNGDALLKDATSSPIESSPSEGIADDANNKPNNGEGDITCYGTGDTVVSIKTPSEDSSKKLYPIKVEIPPTSATIVVGQSSTDFHHDAVEKPKELPDAIAPTKDSLLPGEDVIVVIGRDPVDATTARKQPESPTASQEPAAPQVAVDTGVDEPSTAQAQETRDWDILKSIVYGGLVESITSLGVVSSAAGGGAKTLNTLALGLANLIGGLFVIAHNLRELKESSATSNRYVEQLGRRENFWLHATVVIISFIIFGSVAPITYAFSFRESDNRDYKLAVVAAASLFCILMLAIGKAHVGTPPRSYFKTISYYVIMGFMASGVSFLVGELFDYLLEKLGWFDSTSTVTGAIVEMGTTGSGWASR